MNKVKGILISWLLLGALAASAQSIHFSQFYNAPMLVNPANTAMLPEDDYRAGLNYRTQWAVVPVPYTTFSAFTDFKIAAKSDRDNKSKWLGLGLAFFNDKAGDGNLSLSQIQGNIAYHLQLSEYTMLSAGVSGAYVQRSVNYDNVTFDAQWDGMTFNPALANGEKVGVIKTNYYTVTPGLNFSVFPNESFYLKIGGSVANINQPTESFYKNSTNTLKYRPEAVLDIIYKTGPVLIIDPSVFFATQSGATEIVAGSLFRTVLGENQNHAPTQLIMGAFYRVGDATIATIGMQIGSIQFMGSYDFTMSSLAPYNAAYGALEFSLIYTGKYPNNSSIKKTYNCPRFF